MPSLPPVPRPRAAPRKARVLALAALLLAACGTPAAAQTERAAAPQATSLSLLVTARGDAACTTDQQAVVEEAREVARQRSKAAARLVATEPDHPHIRQWFGDAPRAEIADRLRRTAAQLGRPDTIKVLCNDLGPCEGGILAFARPGLGIIGLCTGFFVARMKGFDSRWGILLHEASHLAAETDDFAYGPRAALIMAKKDPSQAARNADNYEYFVETLPR
jgi:hypothetical protein